MADGQVVDIRLAGDGVLPAGGVGAQGVLETPDTGVSPPTTDLIVPGDQTVTEGDTVDLQVTTTGLSSPMLSATSLPPGLTFDPTTRTISGTVAAGVAANGPYTTTITLSNGANGTETATINWTVLALAAAQPPVVMLTVPLDDGDTQEVVIAVTLPDALVNPSDPSSETVAQEDYDTLLGTDATGLMAAVRAWVSANGNPGNLTDPTALQAANAALSQVVLGWLGQVQHDWARDKGLRTNSCR